MVNEWCFKRLKGWLSANCHVWAQGREVKAKKLWAPERVHECKTTKRKKDDFTLKFMPPRVLEDIIRYQKLFLFKIIFFLYS
jgi:hypothetical protein